MNISGNKLARLWLTLGGLLVCGSLCAQTMKAGEELIDGSASGPELTQASPDVWRGINGDNSPRARARGTDEGIDCFNSPCFGDLIKISQADSLFDRFNQVEDRVSVFFSSNRVIAQQLRTQINNIYNRYGIAMGIAVLDRSGLALLRNNSFYPVDGMVAFYVAYAAADKMQRENLPGDYRITVRNSQFVDRAHSPLFKALKKNNFLVDKPLSNSSEEDVELIDIHTGAGADECTAVAVPVSDGNGDGDKAAAQAAAPAASQSGDVQAAAQAAAAPAATQAAADSKGMFIRHNDDCKCPDCTIGNEPAKAASAAGPAQAAPAAKGAQGPMSTPSHNDIVHSTITAAINTHSSAYDSIQAPQSVEIPVSDLIYYALNEADHNAAAILLNSFVGGKDGLMAFASSKGVPELVIQDDLARANGLALDGKLAAPAYSTARLMASFINDQKLQSEIKQLITQSMRFTVAGQDGFATGIKHAVSALSGNTEDDFASLRIYVLNTPGPMMERFNRRSFNTLAYVEFKGEPYVFSINLYNLKGCYIHTREKAINVTHEVGQTVFSYMMASARGSKAPEFAPLRGTTGNPGQDSCPEVFAQLPAAATAAATSDAAAAAASEGK